MFTPPLAFQADLSQTENTFEIEILMIISLVNIAKKIDFALGLDPV